MLKILHTGDAHLDSPFSSLSLAKSEKAREDGRAVFVKMMRYAKENAYDMVLIAGDLFDGKYITATTRELVLNTLAELDCPVVISPGNHDPYSSVSLYRSEELPENVYIFSSEEMQIFDFDELGVSVCGYAFVTDRLDTSPLENFIPPETDNTLILCAHADIASPVSKYAPITARQIDASGFCYAALGHIHNPPEINSSSALIRYCGFPMGRSFDELGEGGALSVIIEDGKAYAEKIIFSERKFIECNLDVSGAECAEDVEMKIKEFLDEKQYGEDTSLRITLCGTVSLDCALDATKLASLPSRLALLKIKNLTLGIPDSDYLERDITLRGELYRTLLPRLQSDDADERRLAAEALRIGLCAIDGRNLTDVLSLD